tara:strand:+ start:1558 stop:2022 length:465 start_codon:yes stop_codon:yes gene_type:complete
MGKLTAVAVKAALANPGTYQDGGGLFLKVGKTGAASWLLRLQRDGKRQDIGLGIAKLVTLARSAREGRRTPQGCEGRETRRADRAQGRGSCQGYLRRSFPNAVVEAALAHKTPDAARAANRRTPNLGTPDNPGARVKLMEAWGNSCSGDGADAG